jgi:predicted phosphate transport protein (TIGR00153 family)
MMSLLFKTNKQIEVQIDEFLDLVVKGGLIFKQAIRLFLQGRLDDFEAHLAELNGTEEKGDELRRQIESKLYLRTLIPESRGDVLGLLESSDKVLNQTTATLSQFSVETPVIPDDLHLLFIDLSDYAITTAEGMVKAIRAYFREPAAVRDNVNQVLFYRKEANKTAEKFKRAVFRRDLRLSQKIHLRYFAYHVELIAEEAEDVCDRLSIATIKRSI